MDEDWTNVNIALSDCNGAGKGASFNLGSVRRLFIGSSASAASAGTFWIDDIRLYPSRCVAEPPVGDISGDCVVDYYDLDIMAQEWCNGCGKADLKENDMIDFGDFAILANNWLEEVERWP